jgi:hypothetical protein
VKKDKPNPEHQARCAAGQARRKAMMGAMRFAKVMSDSLIPDKPDATERWAASIVKAYEAAGGVIR